MTDKNATPPQFADKKPSDGTSSSTHEAQKPLRPAMVMAVRGDDGGVSPKSGPTKGMLPAPPLHSQKYHTF